MTIPVHYLGAKNEANTIVEPDTFITDNDEFYILQIGEPKEIDVNNPESWTNDALFHEKTLDKFWSMMNLGLTDAYRAINGEKVEYTFFDYKSYKEDKS